MDVADFQDLTLLFKAFDDILGNLATYPEWQLPSATGSLAQAAVAVENKWNPDGLPFSDDRRTPTTSTELLGLRLNIQKLQRSFADTCVLFGWNDLPSIRNWHTDEIASLTKRRKFVAAVKELRSQKPNAPDTKSDTQKKLSVPRSPNVLAFLIALRAAGPGVNISELARAFEADDKGTEASLVKAASRHRGIWQQ